MFCRGRGFVKSTLTRGAACGAVAARVSRVLFDAAHLHVNTSEKTVPASGPLITNWCGCLGQLLTVLRAGGDASDNVRAAGAPCEDAPRRTQSPCGGEADIENDKGDMNMRLKEGGEARTGARGVSVT